ncbi:unnamed protein product [Colias eurytheme]|nr:unnamed protein product [Colias eurytheme]
MLFKTSRTYRHERVVVGLSTGIDDVISQPANRGRAAQLISVSSKFKFVTFQNIPELGGDVALSGTFMSLWSK